MQAVHFGLVLGVLALIGVAYGIGDSYVMRRLFDVRGTTEGDAFDYMEKNELYTRAQFDALHKEEITITSADGLRLHAFYIEPYPESKKVVIVMHGYAALFIHNLPQAEMFIEQGCNVLLVSQRAQGRSEGRYVTFGYREKDDLDQWVEWAAHRKGNGVTIGLFGQSMGGATVLEYASMNRRAQFIIADCPYSDMTDLMRRQFAKRHLPPGIAVSFVNFVMQRRLGFRMSDVSPIRSVRGAAVPILWIHGGEDHLIPASMSQAMYDVKQGKKRIWIVPGAKHADMYALQPEEYREVVREFLAGI